MKDLRIAGDGDTFMPVVVYDYADERLFFGYGFHNQKNNIEMPVFSWKSENGKLSDLIFTWEQDGLQQKKGQTMDLFEGMTP